MQFTKQQKRFLSRIKSQGMAEEVLPLWDKPRTLYDGEDRLDFGIIEGFAEDTDEEVQEWFGYNVRLSIPEHMGWDCTGAAFTVSIHWHRLPDGDCVSFVHRIGYDF